jgi:hypothetical protein
MRYFPEDCDVPTPVIDMDTGREVGSVLNIDTSTGILECSWEPPRVFGDVLQSFDVQFRSVYPICGGGKRPALFHCYGRIEEPCALRSL